MDSGNAALWAHCGDVWTWCGSLPLLYFVNKKNIIMLLIMVWNVEKFNIFILFYPNWADLETKIGRKCSGSDSSNWQQNGSVYRTIMEWETGHFSLISLPFSPLLHHKHSKPWLSSYHAQWRQKNKSRKIAALGYFKVEHIRWPMDWIKILCT